MLTRLFHILRTWRHHNPLLSSESSLLQILDHEPHRNWTSQEVLNQAQLPPGLLYPALLRFERATLVTRQWRPKAHYPRLQLYQRIARSLNTDAQGGM